MSDVNEYIHVVKFSPRGIVSLLKFNLYPALELMRNFAVVNYMKVLCMYSKLYTCVKLHAVNQTCVRYS